MVGNERIPTSRERGPAGPALARFWAEFYHVGQGGQRTQRREGENGGWDPPPPGRSEGLLIAPSGWVLAGFPAPASAPVVPPSTSPARSCLHRPAACWPPDGQELGPVVIGAQWGGGDTRCPLLLPALTFCPHSLLEPFLKV